MKQIWSLILALALGAGLSAPALAVNFAACLLWIFRPAYMPSALVRGLLQDLLFSTLARAAAMTAGLLTG